MRKLISVIASLLFVLHSEAQSLTEKDFTFYSTRDGLSSNDIWAITQDRYGYIWIATRKGLNRFDGSSFLQFFADSSRNSLPEDWVLKLRWLNEETLAASTPGGLHVVNTSTLQSLNYIIPAGPMKYGYKVNTVQDMAGDKNGNVFIITGSGFYHYNRNNELIFRYDHYKSEQVEVEPFQFGQNIVQLQPNILLLSTIAGLYIYNIPLKELHAAGMNDDPFYKQVSEPGRKFWVMHSDASSFSIQTESAKELFYFDIASKTKKTFIASFSTSGKFNWRSKFVRINDTLYAINGKERGFYFVRPDQKEKQFHIEPAPHFENYFCSSVLFDRDGRLWIGTSKGLFKGKKNTANVDQMTIPASMNLFSGDLQVKMITLADNKIFAATNGNGMLVLDSKDMKPLKQISLSSYFPKANTIYNCITAGDTVWVGAEGVLAWIDSRNYSQGVAALPEWDVEHNWIGALYRDSRNSIYACRNENEQFYFRKAGEKSFSLYKNSGNALFRILAPRFITEDPGGNIWFSGHGISRYDPERHQFNKLMDSFPYIKTRRREVLSPVFDEKGMLYFGLPENGLIICDPEKNKFTQLTRTNGLPDNTVRAVYIHQDKVWMGTESGLSSYDLQTKRIASFGIADNIPPDPFSAYSFYYDSTSGKLYGAFRNTIIRFDPNHLSKNSAPPAFFVERIVTGQQVFAHPGNKVELSYRHNNMVMELAAINFEDAYQQQFAYRFVDNGNEAWQQTGTQRSIIFSNLSPGTHRLQLKVFIKNNSWPEQVKEITIVIHPPFWQTSWFIILAVLAVLGILYLLFRYRIRSVRQKVNIDKQLAELEIKGLHAQMNPHFIFNSLNSIKEMILHDEKQNASRYLSKFAQLIRTNLDQSRQTFITVKQCIDHLQQYLEMEKIRFDQFRYSIDLSDELPEDTLIAPMMIQPIVENAIWHGLRNHAGEKELGIRFYSRDRQLVCEIEDNGIGIRQSMKDKTNLQATHRSLGLTSIKERMRVLNEKYHMNSSLEITDRSDIPGKKSNGTLVVLRFNM